jgi:hypothetical protein
MHLTSTINGSAHSVSLSGHPVPVTQWVIPAGYEGKKEQFVSNGLPFSSFLASISIPFFVDFSHVSHLMSFIFI